MGNQCIRNQHRDAQNAPPTASRSNRENIKDIYQSFENEENKMYKQEGTHSFCFAVSGKVENVEIDNQSDHEWEQNQRLFKSIFQVNDYRRQRKSKLKFSAFGGKKDGDLRSTQIITKQDETENQSASSSSVSNIPQKEAGLTVVAEVDSLIQKSQDPRSSILRTPPPSYRQLHSSSPFLTETIGTDRSSMNFDTAFCKNQPFIPPIINIGEEETEGTNPQKILSSIEDENISWSIKDRKKQSDIESI